MTKIHAEGPARTPRDAAARRNASFPSVQSRERRSFDLLKLSRSINVNARKEGGREGRKEGMSERRKEEVDSFPAGTHKDMSCVLCVWVVKIKSVHFQTLLG